MEFHQQAWFVRTGECYAGITGPVPAIVVIISVSVRYVTSGCGRECLECPQDGSNLPMITTSTVRVVRGGAVDGWSTG